MAARFSTASTTVMVAIDELDAKLGVADMKTPTLDAPEPWPSESVS